MREPFVADERTMLEGWLDHHRATLLDRCSGLTAEQLARPSAPPSNLSLQGLVRHLAETERVWFRYRFAGQDLGPIYPIDASSDAFFEQVDPATADADLACLEEEMALAREAVAGADLEASFAHPRGDRSVRWLFVHLIEEYARHNGHADLLREAIDGRRG